MAFPTVAGQPQQSGILIPEVWSPKMLIKFYQHTCLTEITNTDYEGEISKQGDTVHITDIPDITINDHEMGQELEYEAPAPTDTTLLIDKGKSWSFINNLIQQKQSNKEYVNKWTEDAGKQLKINIEKAFFADVYASVHAKNTGLTAGKISGSFNLGATGSPIALDKTNIIDYIVDCGTVLDEQDVPDDQDWWFVMPGWACNLIKKSELKDASVTGDDRSILRNKGVIGMIDRFKIINSNLLSVVTDTVKVTNMLFGHRSALTFATQLVESEGPLKDTRVFGDHYRGLQVYGYKPVKTEAYGRFYAYKG